MKRVALILLSVLMAGGVLRAQYNDFSFGLRGGASTYFTMDNLKSQFGGLGGFDFNYSYMTTNNSIFYIGGRTGLAIAYSTSGLGGSYENHFQNVWNNAYPGGMHIDYTVTAGNVSAKTQQLHLEIPLMGQIQVKGFTMALGVKLMFPVMSTSTQTISDDWKITAYFQETGYSIENDKNHDVIAIGDLTTDDLTMSRKSCIPSFNAMASLEVGYEWTLDAADKSGIGVLFFLDYSLWNTYKSDKTAEVNSLITIDPAESSAEMPAKVNVGMMYNLYADEMNNFSFGAKVYYRFRMKSRSMHSYAYGRLRKADVPEIVEAEKEAQQNAENSEDSAE